MKTTPLTSSPLAAVVQQMYFRSGFLPLTKIKNSLAVLSFNAHDLRKKTNELICFVPTENFDVVAIIETYTDTSSIDLI